MTTEISNSDDTIDSRDVIARIDELENQGDLTIDEQSELAALIAFATEAKGYAADWQYGETLIRESYFTEYAQESAESIGAINSEARWPNNCIDWERAARELKMDYIAVDFDGVTYYVR